MKVTKCVLYLECVQVPNCFFADYSFLPETVQVISSWLVHICCILWQEHIYQFPCSYQETPVLTPSSSSFTKTLRIVQQQQSTQPTTNNVICHIGPGAVALGQGRWLTGWPFASALDPPSYLPVICVAPLMQSCPSHSDPTMGSSPASFRQTVALPSSTVWYSHLHGRFLWAPPRFWSHAQDSCRFADKIACANCEHRLGNLRESMHHLPKM